MVSSLGFNSAYNFCNSSNLIDRAISNYEQNSIFQANPSITQRASSVSDNLIERYLYSTGVYNATMIKSCKSISTPSGVGNYNNYVETDAVGREVVSVKYAKEGSAVKQSVKTTSPDGSTLEKETLNDGSNSYMNMLIKDKSGRVLLEKSKSDIKINDDRKRTIVDDKVYNVSGLTSDVIKIEYDGEVRTIDLRKMTDEKVEKMTVTQKPNGYEDERFEDRQTKITEEERKILYSKIKSMCGDDLFRLTESVDELAYLDAPDGCPESFCNKRALILSKDAPNFVVLHELGHGVNHKNSDDNLISDNNHIKNIRDYEMWNFKKNKQTNDDRFYGKFGDVDKRVTNFNETEAEANKTLCDETFAESYAVLNTTEIVDFAELCYPRTLSLLKYCPKTIAQVETYSC